MDKVEIKITELEELILELSDTRFAVSEPLRGKMFKQHNDWWQGGSSVIKKWENVRSRCGTCIRRTQTNLLKHYHSEIWNEDSGLEVRMIDPQDGRPVFKLKPYKAEEVIKDEVVEEPVAKPVTKKRTPARRTRKKAK